jgi:hypothetical protein
MTAHLINIDTIKEKGYTNGNVEDNVIATTITRVQDTMLKPILGTTFFNRLIEGVDNNDLNSDETTLLDDYITPWMISAVDYRIVKPLTYEIRSKTVGQASDEHIRASNESEIASIKGELFRDLEVYRLALIGYLKENCDLFPEYSNPDCNFGDIQPDKGEKRTNIRFC